MRFWLTWATRDARRRWLQVVSIALLIALGTGMYSAMSSMSRWRLASADASYAQLRMHDLRVSLADGSFVPAGTLAAAASGTTGEERLSLPTQVEVKAGGKDLLVAGRLVGAPARKVDRLAVMSGKAAGPDALLERNFAAFHKLPASGTLKLAGGRTLPYRGQAVAPEYFLVTAPGADFGAEASYAVVFTSLATAQRLSGHKGQVNELVVRAPGANLDRLQQQIAASLHRSAPQAGLTFTRRAAEPAYRLIYKDAKGDQRMMNIFAFLLLGAAAFAAFNMVSRTVEAQRREIGIGMALGVRPLLLGIRPLLLGLEIAVLGVAIGIPVGLWANGWLGDTLRQWFPLPVLETPFEPDVYVTGALLGLILPLLATALPVWRAVRVAPIEAIRVGARSGKTGGLAWLVKGLRLPGGSLGNMPLRNVLRTPRRTVLTSLGIAAIVAIVVALSGLMDSFDNTLGAARQEALGGTPARMTVDFATPQLSGSRPVQAVVRSPAVRQPRQSLRVPVTLGANGSRVNAFLETSARDGLLVARRAAKDLGIGVGDWVSVRHPVPSANGGFGIATTRLRVTGYHSSPFRFIAYTSAQSAARLGLAGLTSRVSVVPAPGHSELDVKRALMTNPGVAAVQHASATTDAVDDRMSQFTDVIAMTVLIAIAMAVLMAYNTSAINADERARENATMFAFGVPVRRVLRLGVSEALLVGGLATVAGFGAGYLLLRWIAYSSMTETMPDIDMFLSISPFTIAAAIAAGLIAVGLAPLFTRRRLRRTDIPSTLRVVE